jgi:hypothetical protein
MAGISVTLCTPIVGIVTIYPVMGEPPLFDDAVQDIVADELDGIMTRLLGGLGLVTGALVPPTGADRPNAVNVSTDML